MILRPIPFPAALAVAGLLAAPFATLSAQSCPSSGDGGTGAGEPPAVSGTVRDTDDGLPLVGARVRAHWRPAGEDASERQEEVWTDVDGRFAVCAPPGGARVRLRARVGSEAGPERTVRAAGGGRSAEVDLRAPLDDPDASSGLIGRLFQRDGGQPVRGAEIRLDGLDRRPVTSGREGRFALDRLPSGTYVLRVEHLAYEAFTDTVHLAPGRPLQMRIPMSTEPIALEGIEVTVRSRSWVRRRTDLYERMERGSGHYITRSEIVERGEPPISSLLRTIPGVRLERTGGGVGPGYFPVIRNCGTPVIYVDRSRIGRLFRGVGIDEFLSSNVEVIEVHSGPASVPIAAARDAACGVIRIWTRDPG